VRKTGIITLLLIFILPLNMKAQSESALAPVLQELIDNMVLVEGGTFEVNPVC